MPRRIRAKRIICEVSDEVWQDVHKTAEELNITMRAYVWRLILPDLINRKKIREEGEK